MDQKPRLVSIFDEALRIGDAGERAAYLTKACGDDAILRARVETLLAADKNAGAKFLEPVSDKTESVAGSARPLTALHIDEALGTRIGPFKLLQKLGEGGMGTVYMAEQSEPVRRKVALKIVKAGMDSVQVLARFEAERQALAMMDHPNIARVFDAGATKAGLPYFVMELVNGVPLTVYCDEVQMPLRGRLELFVDVCRAIQHAHHKGVIHRDIKPSNVLVTLIDDKPVPKVIDFGVAKAMGQKLTDATMYTQAGAIVGTLEYMSPEQTAMSAMGVDVRSDIYSLGVLLYELLTGSTPLDKKRIREEAFFEVLRIIREEEPPKPSTRITLSKETLPETAAKRRAETTTLARQVRGELDWIAMRALEKDRTRRYESANSLARDVERYLSNEPVEACPPSGWYRFRKLVARNKGVFGALGAIAAVLLIGLAFSTYLFVLERAALVRAVDAEKAAKEAGERESKLKNEALAAKESAEKNEKAAKSETEKSKKVTELTNRMLQNIGSAIAYRNYTFKEVLDRFEGNIGDNFKEGPEVEAALRSTVAGIYRDLRDFEKAEGMARRSLQLRRIAYGSDHPDVANSLEVLASILKAKGDVAGAEGSQREAVTIRRKHHDTDVEREIQSIVDLADTKAATDNAAAEALLREAIAKRLDEYSKSVSKERNLALNDHDKLSRLLEARHAWEESENIWKETIETLRKGRTLDFGRYQIIRALESLAGTYRQHGKNVEAEDTQRDAVIFHRMRLGDSEGLQSYEYSEYISSLCTLAGDLRQRGDFDQAETLLREALKISHRGRTDEGKVIGQLAEIMRNRGNALGAEALYREELKTAGKAFENLHETFRSRFERMTDTMIKRGDVGGALSTYETLRTSNQGLLDLYITQLGGVNWSSDDGDSGECQKLYDAALNLQRSLDPDDSKIFKLTFAKAEALKGLEDWDRAEEAYRAGLVLLKNQAIELTPDAIPTLDGLIAALRGKHDLGGIEALIRQKIDIYKKLYGDQDKTLADGESELVGHYLEVHKLKEASQLLEHALSIYTKTGATADIIGPWHLNWAGSFRELGDFVQAEKLDRLALELYRHTPGEQQDQNIVSALNDLAQTLTKRGLRADAFLVKREELSLLRKINKNTDQLTTAIAANGDELRGFGMFAEAEAIYREVLQNQRDRFAPDSAEVLLATANLAGVLDALALEEKTTNTEAAAHDGREAEELCGQIGKLTDAKKVRKPDEYRAAADLFATRGAWKHAVEMLDKTREFKQSGLWSAWYVLQMAPLLVETGSLEARKALRKQALADFGDTDDPVNAERVAKACLLLAPEPEEMDKIGHMVDLALKGTESSNFRLHFEFVKGLYEYRSGRYAQAGEWIEKALAHPLSSYYESGFNALLALASQKLNKPEEARAALAKAIDLAQNKMPLLYRDPLTAWHDWLYTQLFIREARTLIEGKEPTDRFVRVDLQKALKKKVSFEVMDTPLTECIKVFRSQSRFDVFVDAAVARNPINLLLKDMELENAIKWIAYAAGCKLEIAGNQVRFTALNNPDGADALQEDTHQDAANNEVRGELKKLISFEFVDTSLTEGLNFFARGMKPAIVLDPRVRNASPPVINLRVSNLEKGAALRWIAYGAELDFEIKNGAVLFSTPKNGKASNALDSAEENEDVTRRIKKSLEQSVSFEFVGTPLQDGFTFFSRKLDVSVICDQKIWNDPTVMPITLRVAEVGLGKALQLILEQNVLEFKIKNQAIFIYMPNDRNGRIAAVRKAQLDELKFKFGDDSAEAVVGMLALGKALCLTSTLDEAKQVVKDALRISRKNKFERIYHGYVYDPLRKILIAQGDIPAATQCYRDQLEEVSRHEPAGSGGVVRLEMEFLQFMLAHKQFDDARRLRAPISKAAESDTTGSLDREMFCYHWWLVAESEIYNRQWDEAEAVSRDILSFWRKNKTAPDVTRYFVKALVHLQQIMTALKRDGTYKELLATEFAGWERAPRAEDFDWSWHNELADLLTENGKHAEAERVYREVLLNGRELNPLQSSSIAKEKYEHVSIRLAELIEQRDPETAERFLALLKLPRDAASDEALLNLFELTPEQKTAQRAEWARRKQKSSK